MHQQSTSLKTCQSPSASHASVQVRRLQRADEEFMDRVNMYASFYVAIRLESQRLPGSAD